jgi:hypothetical protein
MIVLVNFADERMNISQERCTNSAMRNGVDIVWPQNPNTISREFKDFNRDIFKHDRGFGYWLWKPYHIYKAMLQMKEGDVLIYCDAGVEIIENVNEVISRMDEDIFFFCNGHQHIHWCKMDVAKAINKFNTVETDCGVLLDSCVNNQQVQASVIFFKVNQKTIDFVKEWLLYCQMPNFIDDSPSKLANHPEFAEHRHDQAILTCLQIKYGYRLHYWADAKWYSSQRYRWPEDTYPLMFNHHRQRDKGKGEGKNPEWE